MRLRRQLAALGLGAVAVLALVGLARPVDGDARLGAPWLPAGPTPTQVGPAPVDPPGGTVTAPPSADLPPPTQVGTAPENPPRVTATVPPPPEPVGPRPENPPVLPVPVNPPGRPATPPQTVPIPLPAPVSAVPTPSTAPENPPSLAPAVEPVSSSSAQATTWIVVLAALAGVALVAVSAVVWRRSRRR